MAEKTITIMADFGMGPYAWLKDSSDKTGYVGGNIADAAYGISKFVDVPKELEQDFAEWIMNFENHYDDPQFDWAAFHGQGIELSRKLKCQVKGAYDVVYVAPYEDPVNGTKPPVEIGNT